MATRGGGVPESGLALAFSATMQHGYVRWSSRNSSAYLSREEHLFRRVQMHLVIKHPYKLKVPTYNGNKLFLDGRTVFKSFFILIKSLFLELFDELPLVHLFFFVLTILPLVQLFIFTYLNCSISRMSFRSHLPNKAENGLSILSILGRPVRLYHKWIWNTQQVQSILTF